MGSEGGAPYCRNEMGGGNLGWHGPVKLSYLIGEQRGSIWRAGKEGGK